MVSGMEHKTAGETTLGPGPNSKVKRHADRAHYDAATVYAIVDEALYCTVSFAMDGQPFALPTAHARIDDVIYLHGAAANRMFRCLAAGGRTCISFTLLDGLVMARSAFNHSMNYRSVAIFGAGQEVTDADEKRVALNALVNHAAKGRSAECVAPTPEELKSTLVVRVVIEEASAKVRSGPVMDYTHNMLDTACWAGVIPLKVTASDPIRDAQLPLSREISAPITSVLRSHAGPAPIESTRGELLFSTDKARLDVPMIAAFLRDESYWAKGVDAAAVQTAIDNSLCFGVYREGAQLGFARVVHDGARFGYFADVFVLASERGKGLGKQLVEFVLDHPDVKALGRVLLGTQDAHSLYARYGFQEAPPSRYMVKLRSMP